MTDGSFFTEKHLPSDVDVVVVIEFDVSTKLTDYQRILLDKINDTEYFNKIDGTVWVQFPRGHESFGAATHASNVVADFGLEHGERWLKGYAVVRLRETNVGLRLYR